jgi:hypothetical protein
MSDSTAKALREAIEAFDAGTGPSPAREACALLVDQMMEDPAFNKHPRTRMALMIAARTIRRGRHLTPSEKFENMLRWCEEEGGAA